MQPDPRVAGSAIYAWIAEDLLLYGVAYGMVMDSYAATDASRIRAWTRIAPNVKLVPHCGSTALTSSLLIK